MAKPLTAAKVEGIKSPPKPRQKDYFDSGHPGLALRASYAGSRSWVFYNRFGGKLRRTFLGSYPAMTLAEAREAWREAKKRLDTGGDPNRPKPKPAGVTTKAAAEEFMRTYFQRPKKTNGAPLRERSEAEYRRPIERFVIPVLGDRQASSITDDDLKTLLNKIEDEAGPIACNRAFVVIRLFCGWMFRRGLVKPNPAAGLEKPHAEIVRSHILADDEIRALLPALDTVGWPFGHFVKALLLTGQRRQEIATLRWSDVNLDDAAITIPADRYKTRVPHVIPLSPAAVALFQSLPRFAKPGVRDPYVFSTTGGEQPISGFSRAKSRIDAAILKAGGTVEDWRLHDLRRTVRTGLSALRVNQAVAELTIGHKLQGVLRVYDVHPFISERRGALHVWALWLEALARFGGEDWWPTKRKEILDEKGANDTAAIVRMLESLLRGDAADNVVPLRGAAR